MNSVTSNWSLDKTKKIWYAIGKCTKLEHLELEMCYLDDEATINFQSLTELNHVDLTRNHIVENPVLSHVSNRISYAGNRLSDNGVKILMEHFQFNVKL
mmetsp:Transcript_8135/g.10083  ORF Transcript_8135/g.10083 Transcript_8135/m.10083 type:complete len:99 (+) Transcript_8135:432-728(+)